MSAAGYRYDDEFVNELAAIDGRLGRTDEGDWDDSAPAAVGSLEWWMENRPPVR